MAESPVDSFGSDTPQRWLAACGLLRLLSESVPGVRLYWSRRGGRGWTPVLDLPEDVDIGGVLRGLAESRAESSAWDWLDGGADPAAWAAIPADDWRRAAGAWEVSEDGRHARGGRNPLLSPEGNARPSNVAPKCCLAVAASPPSLTSEYGRLRVSPLGLDPTAAVPAALTVGKGYTETDPLVAWLSLEALPLFPCEAGGEVLPASETKPRRRKKAGGSGSGQAPTTLPQSWATNPLFVPRPPRDDKYPRPVEARLPVWRRPLTVGEVAGLCSLPHLTADPDAFVCPLPPVVAAIGEGTAAAVVTWRNRDILADCGVASVWTAARHYDATRQAWFFDAARELWRTEPEVSRA